ncbi:hypothetical protein EVG20_g3396 [Dentipellis fragilis]|uniref:Uncharacterized protein n=1 Tax=Dentipellis fragilis TaxID=205917 RepID=A0A4Y9Z4Q2_9AGAM|nr:hypothetical protein EVG20_g3396 [Dentipellis fragilis]
MPAADPYIRIYATRLVALLLDFLTIGHGDSISAISEEEWSARSPSEVLLLVVFRVMRTEVSFHADPHWTIPYILPQLSAGSDLPPDCGDPFRPIHPEIQSTTSFTSRQGAAPLALPTCG